MKIFKELISWFEDNVLMFVVRIDEDLRFVLKKFI